MVDEASPAVVNPSGEARRCITFGLSLVRLYKTLAFVESNWPVSRRGLYAILVPVSNGYGPVLVMTIVVS